MVVVGAIELPYAFTMLFGRNEYGNPVTKGDAANDFGHPVCTFEMDAHELKLVVTGLKPQEYRGGARPAGGGIDIYFDRAPILRQALREIVENCARLEPAPREPFRQVPNPSPSVREGGVDVEIVEPGAITKLTAHTYSEFESREDSPREVVVETREMPLYLELEAPQAGDRVHLGGRFWTPYYRHSYIVSSRPAPTLLKYGIVVTIPFGPEYAQLISGMLPATHP